ncbi:MAG: carbamoyl-phosphate synthase large subunit [Methanophagales archaeon]|nr:carbamoyl-phosphate synthase large subunit [Methanophagales archaeon]
MPKRTDIKKILVIGSGPIVIGQAAEFDYSGSQACKALREEDYEIVLVNSNPATIMTDPEMADRVYIEPLTTDILTKIIEREMPDALLPTLGGQTALNLAMKLGEFGVLDRCGVELIGAKLDTIKKAEDRELFKESIQKIGLNVLRSDTANDLDTALAIADRLGYPVVVRPAYTLGGAGGGIAYNREELHAIAERGLEISIINQVLIEEGVIGWKEFELEVMRDLADNVVIICSIENVDAMGVHTGDSITVAPAQTLSDMEYQQLRDAAIAIIREIGVETGGSNIQFAVHPDSGEFVTIEMNPRVSRSSSLASKATGFPIAKIAAKLAVGYTLDEIPNDITKETPASFEPTIDYVVVKIPRFAFDKFPSADTTLGTQMKGVGEVMAIGRTFEEALQKALRSLETGRYGLGCDRKYKDKTPITSPSLSREEITGKLRRLNPERVFYIRYALKLGFSVDTIHELTKIDRWFIHKIKNIVETEEELKKLANENANANANAIDTNTDIIRRAKKHGFSDLQIAEIFRTTEEEVRKRRTRSGINATFKMVDTCAAEFEAKTPYYYSSYEIENEVVRTDKKSVMVIGSGPNRIGQGVEFDYCCVHAVLSLKEEGYETIMVNCNPETVSTDYDTSDRLYFEPITYEDVMNIYENEQPEGVIVQFGGQTPLNIAKKLHEAGVKILGTSPDSIHLAEDRELFRDMMNECNIPQPEGGTARSVEEALAVGRRIGFPVVVRPSFVLGGRGMEIVYDDKMLFEYAKAAVEVSPEYPILIDKFLDHAIEVEVDAIADGTGTGTGVYIAAIMEHIELAEVHSGDSACVIPPRNLSPENVAVIKDYTEKIATALGVVGLINIQYAIADGKVYVLEANPRASRTVPYVSKVIGVPIAKIAAKVMLGKKLKEMPVLSLDHELSYFGVKEAVFPFVKFRGVDPVLGPEMKSTGEVMGISSSFGLAFHKAEAAADMQLPLRGTVLISVADKDKEEIVEVAERLAALGFKIVATKGTKSFLEKNAAGNGKGNGIGIKCELARKLQEGRPDITDDILNGRIQLIINTPVSRESKVVDSYIRRAAIDHKIPYITTTAAAMATVEGIETMKCGDVGVKSIQEYHAGISSRALPGRGPEF